MALLILKQVRDRFEAAGWPLTNQAITQACRKGRIPCQKLGRDWVFDESAIDAHIAAYTKFGRSNVR